MKKNNWFIFGENLNWYSLEILQKVKYRLHIIPLCLFDALYLIVCSSLSLSYCGLQ